jgi:hypothetical protein
MIQCNSKQDERGGDKVNALKVSKKNSKSWHMTKGGNQLVEVIEKAFPIEYIEKNQKKLRISEEDLFVLKAWLQHHADLDKTVDFLIDKVSFYVASATIKSTLYFGGNGILGKLYKHLDLTPQFDEKDNLIKTFSFLDYVDIKIIGTDYRFVKVDINQKKFSSDQSSKVERDKFNKKMVMKKFDGTWKETHDDFAKEYLESYEVLEKLNS